MDFGEKSDFIGGGCVCRRVVRERGDHRYHEKETR
jgi:hypothetical protein